MWATCTLQELQAALDDAKEKMKELAAQKADFEEVKSRLSVHAITFACYVGNGRPVWPKMVQTSDELMPHAHVLACHGSVIHTLAGCAWFDTPLSGSSDTLVSK